MAGRILVVEDDPGVRRLLCDIAETEGCEVHARSSYDEVEGDLDWAEAVVLDLRLPGTDGIEALRRMREEDPDRPVIVVTADPGRRAEASRLGAAAYLVKPFDAQDLLGVLDDVVIDLRSA
jgi:DNA-binding response OmpR family regulator